MTLILKLPVMKAVKYNIFLLLGLLAVMLSFSNEVNAQTIAEKAVPLAGDQRIKYFMYRPETVYEYTGYYLIQSRIDLDPTEKIITISMGDTGLWDIVPSGHRLFIKPKQFEATTNMTIITDKRIYYFELYAEEAESIREGKVNFAVKFVYADSPQDAKKNAKDGSFFELNYPPEPKPEVPDPVKFSKFLNFNYSIAGSKAISPLEIFDDGEFTYFRFKDINADIPAIFEVLPDGNEALINFRKKDGYIIIEKVTAKYTLRFGPQITCIFNETMQLETLPKKEDDTKFFGIF